MRTQIDPFKLERYFAKYEFNVKYLLSSSDCDGFSMQYVLSCAEHGEDKLWQHLTLGYTDSLGHPLLRDAIAAHYNTIKRENVFVLSPGETNYMLMHLLLKPGDEVVCMQPSYQSLYQVAKSIGCNIRWWKSHEGKFNVDNLRELVTEKTKLLIVNFPHNPTGFYPSSDELNQIVAIASRYNTIVFADEMYHKLVDDPKHINDSLCDLYPNSVSLWGMAKSFGLAGLRIGWIATHNRDLLQKMQEMKDYLTICSSAPSEVLSMIALNNSEQFIEVNLIKIRANRKVFNDFVSRNLHIFPNYTEPTAGSTAFVPINLSELGTYETTLAYANHVVSTYGIMLIPAEMFEFGSEHLRIGFGRENMPEALAAWERTFPIFAPQK